MCAAFQLTNFWQDTEVDLRKNRIYLPEEDIKQLSYPYNELELKQDNDNFRKLMKYEVSKTQEIFDEGGKS